MKRLKTFFIYALLIAGFWFLSDFLIYIAINGTYSHIESKVMVQAPNVNISDSKATYVNGYVKGNVYNNTNEVINNQYVKIDLYSPRDVHLGTKFVKIENLQPNQIMDLEMWFKYTDVEYCNISVTDDVSKAQEKQFLSEEDKFYIVLGAVMFLYFI